MGVGIIKKILRSVLLIMMAAGIVAGSFFYEGNIYSSLAVNKDSHLILTTTAKTVSVNRDGQEIAVGNEGFVERGDVIATGENSDVVLQYGEDGELRLDRATSLKVTVLDEQKNQYGFSLEKGRIWLQNAYSNAGVNVLVPGGVVLPRQSVVMVNLEEGKSVVYLNQNDAVVGILPVDFVPAGFMTEDATEIINKLFLPKGTVATVYADKIKENQQTIAKLLLSKMVKEFAYSVFDKNIFIKDVWLNANLTKDMVLNTNIRDQRLKKIRTRGLKYSSLDASNYKLDQSLRDFSNTLTFSDERVGMRDLTALYDLLYDAQYLFDYGRKAEAQERLDNFTSMANRLFEVYGDKLKKQYIERVNSEYEYLSFASPGDSLFGLRQVLERIYLESIKGSAEELTMKFVFLTEKVSTLGYFAENKDFKNIKVVFDEYFSTFKELTDKYKKEISRNIAFVQRQNQALDNLFVQYPALYRKDYFTYKLFVENKYLSLLPSTNDQPEEMQSVIAQRIDFLNRLEQFFLQGDVPIQDAQKIVDLLFSEIAKIQLPKDYQVAVTALFNERLKGYGVFNRFLNSPEYVNSQVRGTTLKQRFDQFQADNTVLQTVDQLLQEKAKGSTDSAGTNVVPLISQETVIIDSHQSSPESATKPKVPRVKKNN